jgi:ElaB/YqjD/DUF883 family membrane-anchored ribosome-binding protein
VADTIFPNIDINKTAADFNEALKEGAYVAVGLGVLGFQRAQVLRNEWARQLESQWEQLSRLSATLNSQFEEYAQTARTQGESSRTQWSEQLAEYTRRLDEALAPARASLSKMISAELPDLAQQLTQASQALEEQLESARAQLVEFAKVIDEQVRPARQQFDEQFDRMEQRLPDGARGVVQSVRGAAATGEQAWRHAVGLN